MKEPERTFVQCVTRCYHIQCIDALLACSKMVVWLAVRHDARLDTCNVLAPVRIDRCVPLDRLRHLAHQAVVVDQVSGLRSIRTGSAHPARSRAIPVLLVAQHVLLSYSRDQAIEIIIITSWIAVRPRSSVD